MLKDIYMFYVEHATSKILYIIIFNKLNHCSTKNNSKIIKGKINFF